jgi:hypothetical protein
MVILLEEDEMSRRSQREEKEGSVGPEQRWSREGVVVVQRKDIGHVWKLALP